MPFTYSTYCKLLEIIEEPSVNLCVNLISAKPRVSLNDITLHILVSSPFFSYHYICGSVPAVLTVL